ncbi:MAG: sulfur carrier protein ThiS [Mycobacterium sp.]
MKVTVNDTDHDLDDRPTVAALLERLGFPDRGVAVALNWAVLPRSQWDRAVPDGARIEVVTAVQGG